MCRDLGLTSRCSSSPGSSLMAISGITRVQNQWAPDGFDGSSVSRLIATRIATCRLRSFAVGSVGTPSSAERGRSRAPWFRTPCVDHLGGHVYDRPISHRDTSGNTLLVRHDAD